MENRNNKNNISTIVNEGLCISCGSCVGICPQKSLRMEETVSGLLHPSINSTKCNLCGLCLKICPGITLNEKYLKGNIDPFKGEYIDGYYGKAANKSDVLESQSGGIVTALMGFLLDNHEIDRCLVTKMPNDGSIRPVCYFASTSQELFESRGSKYCPIALNADLFKTSGEHKIGIVALPCHLHGILNILQTSCKCLNNIKFVVGLLCDKVLSYKAMDHLIKQANVERQNIVSFEFRSKKWRGWPGDVCIHTKEKDVFLPKNERTMIKDVFTPPGCRLCFDKFNIFADVSMGDAWGLTKDKEGMSAIIVRTEQGKNLLLEAQKAGIINLNEIETEIIFRKQGVEVRRKDWAIYMRLWQELSKTVPKFNINPKWHQTVDKQNKKLHLRKLKWSLDLVDIKSQDKLNAKIAKRIIYLRVLRLPIIKSITKKLGLRI